MDGNRIDRVLVMPHSRVDLTTIKHLESGICLTAARKATFMRALLILNDAAYGSERSYDGLRLDAAGCAKAGQKVPEGFYNIQLMLDQVVRHNGQVGVCGTCMDARGIGANELSQGVHRGTMDELARWTAWADKALVF